MVQRTPLQSKTDDRAFPIRVKFVIPFHDRAMWWGLSRRLDIWLRELGRLRCVLHSGGWSVGRQTMSIYFRTLDDAQACVAAFPELELADGVGSPGYTAPGVRVEHN